MEMLFPSSRMGWLIRSACQSLGSSRISIWITRLASNSVSLGEGPGFFGSAARAVVAQYINETVSRQKRRKERGCVADQPQQLRIAYTLRLVEDDTAALRQFKVKAFTVSSSPEMPRCLCRS